MTLIAIVERVFGGLTRLMPRSFSEAQRRESAALLSRLLIEARSRRGSMGVLGVALPALLDLSWRILAESMRSPRAPFEPRRPLADRTRLAVEGLRRDVRDGLRASARRPVHSLAIIVTLALGIGLNAAVFSIVDWVLLRPLPYPSSDELVRVSTTIVERADGVGMRYSEIDRVAALPSVRAAAGYSIATRVASGDRFDPAHVTLARVSGDLFGVLGVNPHIGRPFGRDERGQPVAIVSDALWRNQLAADPGIVGRLITIDNVAHTVIGVMPAGRGYPKHADVWRPATDDEREDDDRENVLIARAGGGASGPFRAQAGAALVADRAEADRPIAVVVDSLQEVEVRNLRLALVVIFSAAAVVLLVACANVAALLGGRSAERAGEWAVRGALGARQAQLTRQLAVECGLLALAGSIAGLVLASWTLDLVIAIAPAELPRVGEIGLDARLIALGVMLVALVCALLSLAPARTASKVDLRSTLMASLSPLPASAARRRMLVFAQVMLAVVLTVGAGLLTRSLQRLIAIDHGFDPANVVSIDLTPRGMGPDQARALFQQLTGAAAGVPSVRSAAVAFRLPTDVAGFGLRRDAQIDGQATVPAMIRIVTPEYFRTVGIPLLEGRPLAATDTRRSARVGLVNRAFTRALDTPAVIGRSLTIDLVNTPITIVGVVADISPAGERDRPALYLSYEHLAINAGSLLVRTDVDPATVLPSLVSRLRAAAPGLAFDRIWNLEDLLAKGRAVARFNVILSASFGALAILLALTGIYGLAAGEIAVRRREAGVRLALGATKLNVAWSLLAPIARLMFAATLAGMLAATVLSIGMRALLEGVPLLDPVAFGLLPLLLAGAGLLAAAAAARPLLRADPAATLRA